VAAPAPAAPQSARERLRDVYRDQVVPAMMREFGYTNALQVPRVVKIVINTGLGEAITNSQAIQNATRDLATITGQRPVVTKAKKSIASFKLRQGMSIGAMVTLRGDRAYAFLDKLVNVALPRVRDFSGVSPKSFDGRGSYTLGLREQLMFPEIEYDKVDKIRGMQVTIVTNARSDEEGRRLLALFGMPFRNA
jgi:large subunit ribosomal protein L5